MEDPSAPMFDFAWSEIAVIAAVALVVIGPKDLPVAIKAVTGFIRKARGMAAEFQTHVDEMVREADLKGVKDSFNQVRDFNLRSTVEKAIDPDHTIRDAFSDNPLDPTPGSTYSEAIPNEPEPEPVPEPPARIAAPAFVPPSLVPFVDPPPEPAPPPAFIPPFGIPAFPNR